jgi:hypothetical protein
LRTGLKPIPMNWHRLPQFGSAERDRHDVDASLRAEARVPGATLKRDQTVEYEIGERRYLCLFVLVDASEPRSVPSSKAA